MAKTEDSRLVYPHLMDLLDPTTVFFQFQISSMRVKGDPVMYFTKYPGRFLSTLPAVHSSAMGVLRAQASTALPCPASERATVPQIPGLCWSTGQGASKTEWRRSGCAKRQLQIRAGAVGSVSEARFASNHRPENRAKSF